MSSYYNNEDLETAARAIREVRGLWRSDDDWYRHHARAVLDTLASRIAERALHKAALQIRAEVLPLLDKRPRDGGYNCCGCSSYSDIVDDCLRILSELGAKP